MFLFYIPWKRHPFQNYRWTQKVSLDNLVNNKFIAFPKGYLGSTVISKMELFVNFQPFDIFAENSTLDDRLRFEYASVFSIRSIGIGKTSNYLFCQIFMTSLSTWLATVSLLVWTIPCNPWNLVCRGCSLGYKNNFSLKEHFAYHFHAGLRYRSTMLQLPTTTAE